MPGEERPAPAEADFTFDRLMAELLELTHLAGMAAGRAGGAADRVERLCAKAATLREKAGALTEKAEAGAMRVASAAHRAQGAVAHAEAAQGASEVAARRVHAETACLEQTLLQAPARPSPRPAPPQAGRTAGGANNSSASPLPLPPTDAEGTPSLDDLLAQVLELSHKAETH